jgi:hypothetical protein
MAISGWLAVCGWTAISQIEARDLEAAPWLFRLVSPPTVMERPIEVAGLGSRPAVEWLALVAQESPDKALVLDRLHRAGLARLAIPDLLRSVQDIDHPDFGVSNQWLTALNALPPGHWGYEHADADRAARGDTTIARVMLARAGAGLRASWDVYFNENQPINSTVTARRIVLVFKAARSGAIRQVDLDASPGWNRGRDVELFADIAPGAYLFQAYARRNFDNGLHDRTPWPAPETKVELP